MSAFFQAIFALAITLGIFGLCVAGLRRYGPNVVKRLQAVQGPRRLKVVESLMLDPSRKLLLVDIDGAERLILLGEARFVDPAPIRPARKPAQ